MPEHQISDWGNEPSARLCPNRRSRRTPRQLMQSLVPKHLPVWKVNIMPDKKLRRRLIERHPLFHHKLCQVNILRSVQPTHKLLPFPSHPLRRNPRKKNSNSSLQITEPFYINTISDHNRLCQRVIPLFQILHIRPQILKIHNRIVRCTIEPRSRCILQKKSQRKEKFRTQIQVLSKEFAPAVHSHRSPVMIGRIEKPSLCIVVSRPINQPTLKIDFRWFWRLCNISEKVRSARGILVSHKRSENSDWKR